MNKIVVVTVLALLAAGCQEQTQRIEHVQEIGPTAAALQREMLATQERVVGKVMDALGGMQRTGIEAVQKAEAERQHRCWLEGNRNCSGGSSSYYPNSLSRAIR